MAADAGEASHGHGCPTSSQLHRHVDSSPPPRDRYPTLALFADALQHQHKMSAENSECSCHHLAISKEKHSVQEVDLRPNSDAPAIDPQHQREGERGVLQAIGELVSTSAQSVKEVVLMASPRTSKDPHGEAANHTPQSPSVNEAEESAQVSLIVHTIVHD